MCLGRIFVTIGVAVGLAGPAEALMSTHALYQSLLSAIFDGQTLSLLEILGVLFGLGGVFCMAFIDTVYEKFKMRKEIRRLKSQESMEASKASENKPDEYKQVPIDTARTDK